MMMNWTNLISLRAWTPLSEIHVNTELVMDGIYRVGEDMYLRAQPYNKNLEADSRSPFVTRLYWSPTLNGLKRLVLGDPAFSRSGSLSMPPQELMLGTNGQYSELIKHVPPDSAKFAEKAVYSPTGAFLFRTINIGRLNYCFEGSNENDEQVSLIDISLAK